MCHCECDPIDSQDYQKVIQTIDAVGPTIKVFVSDCLQNNLLKNEFEKKMFVFHRVVQTHKYVFNYIVLQQQCFLKLVIHDMGSNIQHINYPQELKKK